MRAWLSFVAFSLCCAVLCDADTSLSKTPKPEELAFSETQLWSPDGQFVLVNITKEPKDPKSLAIVHTLWVIDPNGASVCVYKYFVSASALWCPDSRHLIVDVNSESNEADCILIALDSSPQKISFRTFDISEKLKHLSEAKAINDFSHQYVIATKWKDDHTVSLDVRAHARIKGEQPLGVHWRFSYDVVKDKFTKEADPPDDDDDSVKPDSKK